MEAERQRMVKGQLAARGIHDRAVLRAMGEVPRKAFVPGELAEFAYTDTPLPIEAGQTISQPYIVALMLQALEPEPGDRVLEIGAQPEPLKSSGPGIQAVPGPLHPR